MKKVVLMICTCAVDASVTRVWTVCVKRTDETSAAWNDETNEETGEETSAARNDETNEEAFLVTGKMKKNISRRPTEPTPTPARAAAAYSSTGVP